MRTTIGLVLLGMFGWAAAASGCGSADDDLFQQSQHSNVKNPECGAETWRKPTDGAVICPGLPDCLCGGGNVCCVTLKRLTNDAVVDSSSCIALQDCAHFANSCDGPEDCGEGLVCCATGPEDSGNMSCKAPIDCIGADTYLICRSDADCTIPGTHCVAADPSGAYAGLIAACQ